MSTVITLTDGEAPRQEPGSITPEEWYLLVLVAAWAKANHVPTVKVLPWSQYGIPLPGIPQVHGLTVFPPDDAPTAELARHSRIAAGNLSMETHGQGRSFRLYHAA